MKTLFILSSPHGGSTLLADLVGRLPNAANLGEVSFIPKYLALGEPCTCGEMLPECAVWRATFERLEESTHVFLPSDPYGLFLGDAIKQKRGAGLVDTRHQTRTRKIVSKMRGAVDTLVLLGAPNPRVLKTIALPSVRTAVANTLALYNAAAQTRHTSLVIDASKSLKKAFHLYLDRPEDVRILHLTRDVRSVCASRMGYMPVRRAAERWNHYHSLSRTLLNKWVAPEHCSFLRYEDLVQHPELHLQEICQWLGVHYDSRVLDFSVSLPSHSAGGNPSRFHLDKGIKVPEERWRVAFSEQDFRDCARYGGKLSDCFGYTDLLDQTRGKSAGLQ